MVKAKSLSVYNPVIVGLANCPVPVKLIKVPAGKVCLGTSDIQVMLLEAEPDWPREDRFGNFFRDEQPQHTISINAFAIGQTPVTNAQYLEFVIATGADFPRTWPGLTFPEGQGDYPVTSVSWRLARAYCKWLSELSGHTIRLPTEAEWERAARGDDDRTYPWGSDFHSYRINTAEAFSRATTPVFLHSPASDSPFGVVGMSGNVWQWTSSIFSPYPYDASDGREDLDAPGPRVVRGGAWLYSRRLARCSAREGYQPDVKSHTVGFRIAMS